MCRSYLYFRRQIPTQSSENNYVIAIIFERNEAWSDDIQRYDKKNS